MGALFSKPETPKAAPPAQRAEVPRQEADAIARRISDRNRENSSSAGTILAGLESLYHPGNQKKLGGP